MARLSKKDTYAILWLNHTGLETEDIAKELSVSLQQVNSILEKNNTTNTQTNTIKTVQQPVGINNKNLMITETSQKKNNTVAIMTQQASAANDEIHKKMSNKNSKNDGSIFRPKNK